jgi:penicillin-binding protein 1C
VEVETGNVLSYIGNTEYVKDQQDHANYVDVIQARRSSGSILKPILYAYMLEEGIMLPKSLVEDIPTIISGYQPENYNRQYTGVVPADEALQRSLNVPAVNELQQYGYPRFYLRLKKLGFSTLNRSADNYGLTLILGGAEVKLWDLAKVYSSMARVLNNYHEKGYDRTDWRAPNYIVPKPKEFQKGKLMDATSIWFAFDAMRNLNRPQSESGWQQFSSTRNVAWKTGTSHGFRDAWAIGLDSK